MSSLTIGRVGGWLDSVVGGRQITVPCVPNPDLAPGTLMVNIPFELGTDGRVLPCVPLCYLLMSTEVPCMAIELSGGHGAQLMRPLTAWHLLQTELMLSVADVSISGISMMVSV